MTRKIAAAALIFLCTYAWCQQHQETVQQITVQDAIIQAEAHNANIQSLRIARDAAARSYQNSWNTLCPDLSISGGISNVHELSSSVPSVWDWNANGGLSMTLTASIPAQVTKNRIAYNAADIAYRQAQSELYNSVSQIFYDLISQQENIILQKESLELAQTHYAQVRTKYNSGLSSELDLLNAQYAVESQKLELTRLETAFLYDMNTFCVSIGIDYTQLPVLSGSIDIVKLQLPSTQECIARYASKRFDVQSAQNKLESAKNAAQLLKTGLRAPSITLREQINCKENSNDDVVLSGTFSASVQIPLNGFIPGTSESLSIKEKNDIITSALLDVEQTQKNAAIDITNKVTNIDRVLASIEAAALNQKIATRTWELAQESFRNGLIDQKDFEDYRIKKIAAQQTLLKTNVSYLTAVNNLAEALAVSPDELYSTFSAEAQKK